ncbi:MAG TPA: NADH-quinone oxidoreductase subunit NuoH [Candidatus Krumholzibacteria bacterium]|nr:NADH-quinone oxidoreductase subunit NuoH [Candidatus Krumholzibacteria bacterium]
MQQYLDSLIARWGIQTDWQVALLYAAGMLVFASLILLLWVAPLAGFTSFIERRIAARIQSRVGPNRVGPQGILQWIADGLKCLLKEDLIPRDADPILFKIAPYLVFMGMFGTFAVLPFAEKLIVADLNVGLFYLVAVTAFIAVGIIMAGWASNNKWALLGGMRSANQIVSYEIPSGMALLAVVLASGTMSTQGIIREQGWLPWDWNLFRTPFLFIAFFIYFIAALAESNRTPFDLPEGESELVAGYNTEYSGMRFAFFFLAEWAELYVIAAVATLAFLGGWQVPSFVPDGGRTLVQVLCFVCKSFFWMFVIIWIRWTLPRVRVDQMMELCWKYLVPMGFVVLVGTAVWETFVPRQGAAALAVRLALFLIAVAAGVRFMLRVRYNLRESGAQVRLNPIV